MKRVAVLYSVCCLSTLLVAFVAGLSFTWMFWTSSGPNGGLDDPTMGFLASVAAWFSFPWHQILNPNSHFVGGPTRLLILVLPSLSWGLVLYFFHQLLRLIEDRISAERHEKNDAAQQGAAANGAPRRPCALPLGGMSEMKKVAAIYSVCCLLTLSVAMVAMVATKVFIRVYSLLVGPPDFMIGPFLVSDRMWFFFPWRPTVTSNFDHHIAAPKELLIWVLSSLSWGAVLYLFHQLLQWIDGLISGKQHEKSDAA